MHIFSLTQNSLINFFSKLIITLRGVYNEIHVGVKFSPLSILRISRCLPKNQKIGENFNKCHIFANMLAINPNKISAPMFPDMWTLT